jgi:hypothetical protein
MVQRWIADAPHWLEIRPAVAMPGVGIAELDAGEAAAIRLAEQLGETAFLPMDDAKGRREATRRGIPSTGTLGVLRAASKNRYLALRDVLPRLLQTTFTSLQAWCGPSLPMNKPGRARVTDPPSRARFGWQIADFKRSVVSPRGPPYFGETMTFSAPKFCVCSVRWPQSVRLLTEGL